MSRSKHTRPRRILAADRVVSPRAHRGDGDLRDAKRVARRFKDLGIVISPQVAALPREIVFPRIAIARPRAGEVHAVTRREIQEALLFFGPECFYGLRSITVASRNRGSRGLALGRYVSPGQILIYSQTAPPWLIDGVLSTRSSAQLVLAGAQIALTNGGNATTVDWPSRSALRDYYLIDVLMHEIGHHMIQHYRRRPLSAAARTNDHEGFADAFARQCRIAWREHTTKGSGATSTSSREST